VQSQEARRIALMFELALGRAPSSAELAEVQRFLREFPRVVAAERAESEAAQRPRRDASEPKQDAELEAWAAFALSLFQTAEFRYSS